MGLGGKHHAPAALPPGKTRYQLRRRLGGPQGRSGRVRQITPQPGIGTRTVQPVARHSTDWALPAHAPIYSHILSHPENMFSKCQQVPHKSGFLFLSSALSMDGRPVDTFDLLKCSVWLLTLHSPDSRQLILPVLPTFLAHTHTSLYLPHVPFDIIVSVLICEIP